MLHFSLLCLQHRVARSLSANGFSLPSSTHIHGHLLVGSLHTTQAQTCPEQQSPFLKPAHTLAPVSTMARHPPLPPFSLHPSIHFMLKSCHLPTGAPTPGLLATLDSAIHLHFNSPTRAILVKSSINHVTFCSTTFLLPIPCQCPHGGFRATCSLLSSCR